MLSCSIVIYLITYGHLLWYVCVFLLLYFRILYNVVISPLLIVSICTYYYSSTLSHF